MDRKLQLDFLKTRDLLPHHKLLDFGCGQGKLLFFLLII